MLGMDSPCRTVVGEIEVYINNVVGAALDLL